MREVAQINSKREELPSMIRNLTSWTICILAGALLFCTKQAQAEDSQMALERSKTTTLVFLKPGATPDLKDSILNDSNLKIEKEFVEEKGDWFVARMSPEEARDYIMEKYGDAAHIERNSVFYPMSGPCDDNTATALPSGKDTPAGVVKMGGPLQGTAPNRKVWIIDSGVDVNTDKLTINLGDAALCLTNGINCKSANADPQRVMDDSGHGTFVAGIIAGKDVGNGSILGMVPGATVVPIKVSDKANPTPNADTLLRAMKWVIGETDPSHKAVNGDVVNISLGMLVDWENIVEDSNTYTVIETMIRQLAASGVKVSVAAGNLMQTDATAVTGGYVELLSPARLGGYRTASGGGIVTVSGIDANDKFWFTLSPPSGSFFGNGPRPDFAAPSVDVQSLWINNKQNKCTGTSFAAAYVSGALLQSEDIDVTTSTVDIMDVDSENDMLVTCKKNTSGTCDTN